MAFVIPSASKVEKVQDTPGPTDYVSTQPSKQQPSYAPFNSTQPRNEWCGIKPLKKRNVKSSLGTTSIPKSTDDQYESIPGPGQYNPPTTVAQVYDVPKSGAPALKSKVPRFSKLEKQETIPSHLREHRNQAGQQQPHHKPNQIMQQTNNNYTRKVSSIRQPNHYVRVIYTDPHNSQNIVSKYVNSSFVNKNIGPGDYDLTLPDNNSKNVGASWGKSKTLRLQPFPRSKSVINEPNQTQGSIGPGSYSPKNCLSVKQDHRQSSVFSSEGVRSFFDNLIYNTNIQQIANLREFIQYKAPVPGPGSYNLQTKQYGQNHPTSIYQFFGSTSERFQPLNPNREDRDIGPGSYDLPSDFNKQQKKPRKTMSNVQQMYARFRGILSNSRNSSLQGQGSKVATDLRRKPLSSEVSRATPGPGHYSSKVRTLEDQLNSKLKKGYRGQFGTKQSRFQSTTSEGKRKKSKSTPGPGYYNVNAESKPPVGGSIPKAQKLQTEPSAVPFGKYNIEVYDLGSVVARKKEFLENLKRISVTKPPFESAVKRFKTETQTHTFAQTTTQKDDQLHVLSSTAQERKLLYLRNSHRNPKGWNVFVSQSKRFDHEVPDLPPPGHYNIAKELEKPSFSLKYGYRQ